MAKRHTPEPSMLLVEGEEDKRVIPQLMEANGVPWGEPPPVFIEPCGGFESMVEQNVIQTELKATGLEVLGIIADANNKAGKRWGVPAQPLPRNFPPAA